MLLGYFCSSKYSSKQAWQKSRLHCTNVLQLYTHNVAAATLNIDDT